MNVKELIEYLQKFKNPEQLQVIIKAKTMGPKLGSMDYAKIKQVYRGIDWNINLVIIDPEEELFTEKGHEEKKK
jgi:hypothetical protein